MASHILLEEYIEFTGNTDILDIETNYLQGESLQEGIDEKYDLFLKSDIKETIYEHCKRAIEIGLKILEKTDYLKLVQGTGTMDLVV